MTVDLRQWAERTAPTLTAADWPLVGAVGRKVGGHGVRLSCCRCTPKQARALLAYRDEVARGLTADEQQCLVWHCLSEHKRSQWYGPASWPGSGLPAAHSLLKRGLLVSRTGFVGSDAYVLDWGRVIAERARELSDDR